MLFINCGILESKIGRKVNNFDASIQKRRNQGHGQLMGQCGENHIGFLRNVIQVIAVAGQIHPAVQGRVDAIEALAGILAAG